MNRRRMLQWIATLPFVPPVVGAYLTSGDASPKSSAMTRVQPGDPRSPSRDSDKLNRTASITPIGGNEPEH